MTKNILVIAPTVPRHDMSSGDLRLYSLLKILSSSWNITFIPLSVAEGDDACLDDLRHLGVTLNCVSNFYNLIKSTNFDVALIEFYDIAMYYCPRLRLVQPECLIVTDSVDVHFLRYKMKADLFPDPTNTSKYEKTKKDELLMYEKSDLVLTVTPDDRQALVDAGITSAIRIIPNIHVMNPGTISSERKTLVFVGGFTHDPNIDAVTYFVNEVLPRIKSRMKGVRLFIVGNKPPQEILELQSDDIIVTGYVPSTTPYLRKSYISVAPLRYGAGMKGKIGEAMAHGIPVVTTSVGAQGMGLSDSVNIMIADDPDGFAAAVIKLIENEELYSLIRKNGLDYISNNFSIDVLHSIINRVFKESYQIKRFSLIDKLSFFYGYFCERISKLFKTET